MRAAHVGDNANSHATCPSRGECPPFFCTLSEILSRGIVRAAGREGL
jgi:hypothetical protein